MVTNIEISGYVEDMLDALVMAGIYSSKTEAVRDAVRRLLNSYDLRDVALKAYRNGSVSFQLAAEIGNSSLDEMLWYMLSHNVAPELGSVDMDEVRQGAESLRSAKALVFDSSAVYTMLELGIADYILKVDARLLIPDKVRERSQALVMKMSKLKGMMLTLDRFERASGGKRLVEVSRKNGISLQESQAIYIAKVNGGVVISDDIRTRRSSRALGVQAVPTLSVLQYLASAGAMEMSRFRDAVLRMGAIPYMVPAGLV